MWLGGDGLFFFHWGHIFVFWRPVQRSQNILEGVLSGSNVDLTCQWDFLFNGEEDVWEGGPSESPMESLLGCTIGTSKSIYMLDLNEGQLHALGPASVRVSPSEPTLILMRLREKII